MKLGAGEMEWIEISSPKFQISSTVSIGPSHITRIDP